MTSRNQPHCLISRRLATNHITSFHLIPHHITAHDTTTTETKPASAKTPPPDGTSESWASHWLVALRAFYGQILSLAHRFFPSETSTPNLSGHYRYRTFTSVCALWNHATRHPRKSSRILDTLVSAKSNVNVEQACFTACWPQVLISTIASW